MLEPFNAKLTCG